MMHVMLKRIITLDCCGCWGSSIISTYFFLFEYKANRDGWVGYKKWTTQIKFVKNVQMCMYYIIEHFK